MSLSVDQVSVIRSQLNATGYVAGAKQITQANADIAKSGEAVTQAHTRTTRALVDTESAAARWMARMDPQIRKAQQLAAAQDQMNRFVQRGLVTAADGATAYAAFAARMGVAGTAARATAQEVEKLGHVNSRLFREGTVMAHELITGRYSRIPGSFLVLFEFMPKLQSAIMRVGAAALSPIGLAALGGTAVLGGLALMAAGAERAAHRLHDLQNALRVTRPDAFGLAPEVLGAASEVAATSGLSTSSARGFAQTIASSPSFAGGQARLVSLVRTAADLDAVFGKAGDGAKMLAHALDDPGRVAQELADKHFAGMSQALAWSIRLMAESGDRVQAFNRDLEVLRRTSEGAAQPATALSRAWRDVGEAFTRTGQDGRSLSDAIGGAVANAAASALEGIASIIGGIEHLREVASAGAGAGGTGFNPAAGAPGALAAPTLGPALASGERAVGLYQVLPSTAAGLGYSGADLASTGGNIAAGMATLMQAYFASHGNINQALARYGGYGTDVQAAQGYIGKVRGANPAQLDPAVLAAIQAAEHQRNLPVELRSVFERLPLVESGGRQFAAPRGAAGAPGPSFGPQAPTADQMVASQQMQGNYDAAFKLYTEGGSLSARQAQNSAQQQLLERGIGAAQQFGDAAGVAHLQEALARLRGEASSLISEQEKLARSAADANAPLQAEAGAARTLAGVYQHFAEAARSAGQSVDRVSLGRAQAAELAKLSASANDNVSALNLQAAAEERLVPLLERGGVASQLAANHERAIADARKTALAGTSEYARQVLALSVALDRETQAKASGAAAGSVHRLQQEIEMTRTQIGLLSASNAERARQIAMLRERQSLGIGPGETATPAQQHAVDLAGQAADWGTAMQQMQQVQTSAQQVSGALSAAFHGWTAGGKASSQVLRELDINLAKIVTDAVLLRPFQHMLEGFLGGGASSGGGSGGSSGGGAAGGTGMGILAGLGSRMGDMLTGHMTNSLVGSLTGGGGGAGAPSAAAAGGGHSWAGNLGNGLLGSVAGRLTNGLMGQGGGWLGSLFGGGGTQGAASAGWSSGAASGADAASSGGWLSSAGSWLSSFFHEGGLVGAPATVRPMPAWLFADAPRFHSGLGSDEFAAVLQRGERVLTANQNARVGSALGGLAAGAGGHTFNFNISTPNAESFSRSQGQIAARAAATLGTVGRRA